MPNEARIAVRKARWEQFYDLSSDTRFLLVVHYTENLPEQPLPNPDLKTERIQWAWTAYQSQMDALNWLDDDRVPFLNPYSGTEIFAEAFGCRVHYTADKMPFALPCVRTPAEAARLRIPDWSETRLATLFEIADELCRRAGPGAVLRLPDIQSPMDIAALIWDKNTFYPALVEDPEPVQELAQKVRMLLTSFLDAWFARYGSAFMAHFPDYFMPRGITLSEDEVGAVSPAMFSRYFLPELEWLANRYGAIGMHCCAHARHQWQGFLKIPNLTLVNLSQPQAVLIEASRIFAPHAAQMHSWRSPIDLDAGPGQFSDGSHQVIQMTCTSRTQAEAVVSKFRTAWQPK